MTKGIQSTCNWHIPTMETERTDFQYRRNTVTNVLWCVNRRGPNVQAFPINTHPLISSFRKIRGKVQNCPSKVKNISIFKSVQEGSSILSANGKTTWYSKLKMSIFQTLTCWKLWNNFVYLANFCSYQSRIKGGSCCKTLYFLTSLHLETLATTFLYLVFIYSMVLQSESHIKNGFD